ncbi:hypothetical protein [Peptostreptococcus russellii]|uniref:hypothetical protein n=1 Tax=Peptostreptococcus russellii TaxID=215200 RepID=UPI003F58D124
MEKTKKYILILYLNILFLYPIIFLSNKLDPHGKIENSVIIFLVTATIFTSCAVRLHSIKNKDDIIFRNLHLHIISFIFLVLTILLLNKFYILLCIMLLIIFNAFIFGSTLLTKNNIPSDEQSAIFKNAISLPITLFALFNLITKELRAKQNYEMVQTVYLILCLLIMLISITQLIFLLRKSLKNKDF